MLTCLLDSKKAQVFRLSLSLFKNLQRIKKTKLRAKPYITYEVPTSALHMFWIFAFRLDFNVLWMNAPVRMNGRFIVQRPNSNRKYEWWQAEKPFFRPEKSAFLAWKVSHSTEKVVPFRPENSALELKRYLFMIHTSIWFGSCRYTNINLCTNVQYVCYVTADAWNILCMFFIIWWPMGASSRKFNNHWHRAPCKTNLKDSRPCQVFSWPQGQHYLIPQEV